MLAFKNLETFYWVAVTGSFRQTAVRLNTTQPAISARIAALEAEIGSQLFERSGRQRSQLTAIGVQLLPRAERMLEVADEITAVTTNPKDIQGVIRIGVSETLIHTWFPDLLTQIGQRFPGLIVETQVDTTVALRAELVSRNLDIGFLMGPIAEPSMQNQVLSEYPVVWVASPRFAAPNKALTVADVAALPINSFPRNTRPYQDLVSALRGGNLPALRINCCSSLNAIIHLTAHGHGVSALPDAVAAPALLAGSLRQLTVDFQVPALRFTATYPHGPQDRLARQIAALAREICEHPAGTAGDDIQAQGHQCPEKDLPE